MTRNLICIKNINGLSEGDKLLYNPYKNLVNNLFLLATQKEAIEFDPISKAFSGIDSADETIKHYYEALLGVTSYFQASKGGRGKYIEKRFASALDTCNLNISIKKLPIWIEYPKIFRKKNLFGDETLTHKEKSLLRLTKWDWIGEDQQDNETSDLANIHGDTISFFEIKNRIDSGGVSARREVWGTKFLTILNLFISDKKIFKKKQIKYSLSDLYYEFNISKIKLGMGILFSIDGSTATVLKDKNSGGFYSENKTRCINLKNFIDSSKKFDILDYDLENLKISIRLRNKNFDIDILTAYGNDVSKELLDLDINLNSFIFTQYDDIWLSQLLSIDERARLLKYGVNVLTKIISIFENDRKLRKLFNKFIESNGNMDILNSLVDIIKGKIDNNLIPLNRVKEDYICDILYFYGCAES